MTEPATAGDTSVWAGIVAAIGSAGAFIGKTLKNGHDVKRLGERSHAHARELTGHESRLARVEQHNQDMDGRLTRIEASQVRIEEKLDRAIEREIGG